MRKRKTHEEFCKEMYIKNPLIEIIGLYDKAVTMIKVKCLKCNGEWEVSPNSLLRGNGCPYCCSTPRKILVGFNDMWTTNPELAKLLLNPEDGYKYTQSSGVKVDWKCPNCDFIVRNKIIANILKRGLSCSRCGDKVSYSEKFISALLSQTNIDFEKEKSFSWSMNRRYDFYISKYSIIVEIHGKQHYSIIGFNFMNKRSRNLSQEQENDDFKEQLAKENNIKNYIIIDARYSDFEFIKNNIINSELNILLNLSNIDWLKCHEYACKNLIKEACNYWNNDVKNIKEIALILKLSRNTIWNYLKQGVKLGWCDYDPKEELIKNGKNNRECKYKKVMCIETGIIYKSILEASESVINGNHSHISSCCRGKRKSCGKLKDGTKLHWKYAD